MVNGSVVAVTNSVKGEGNASQAVWLPSQREKAGEKGGPSSLLQTIWPIPVIPKTNPSLTLILRQGRKPICHHPEKLAATKAREVRGGWGRSYEAVILEVSSLSMWHAYACEKSQNSNKWRKSSSSSGSLSMPKKTWQWKYQWKLRKVMK